MHRILHLPPDTFDFVQSRVEGGQYENPGELVQAAFRALHREERGLEAERAASGVAEDDAFRKLQENLAKDAVQNQKP